ncbi:hypothetical protein Bbelb_072610 [Branchiostoma belcheri]|nr:hypothetical protein Bbelb_072610 [Branchiostoma belcheri]
MSAWRRILFCPDHHRTDETKLSTTVTSRSVRFAEDVAAFPATCPQFLRTDAGIGARLRILFRRSSEELQESSPTGVGLSTRRLIEQVNWEARNTQPMCAAHACYVRCPYSNCPIPYSAQEGTKEGICSYNQTRPKKWAAEDDRAASKEDDRREEESDGSSHLHALITCEEEHSFDGRVADNAETPTVEEEKENDEGLIMKKGCEDHQEGHEWGTSEHDNCYCQLEGPDLFRFCYHVDCLPGSEIVRDSKGLWDCPGDLSTADSSEKRADMSMLEDSLLQILEGEDHLDLGVADDEETPAVAEENALDLRGEADEGLIKKTGCEGHQLGEQWGSSDHNCICGGADRFCYPVVCLPGSQIKPDSKGLLRCEVDSSKRDITGSALSVTERENLKREPITAATALAAFGVFTEVVGLVGFALDRYESAQTTQQLNEIQGQIRVLDGKIDDLTRSVSDLQLGQDYLSSCMAETNYD